MYVQTPSLSGRAVSSERHRIAGTKNDYARSLLLLLRNLQGRLILVYRRTELPARTHHESGTNGGHDNTRDRTYEHRGHEHQTNRSDRKHKNWDGLGDSSHLHDTDCHFEGRNTIEHQSVTVKVIYKKIRSSSLPLPTGKKTNAIRVKGSRTIPIIIFTHSPVA
jgi:hypothetical protein